MTDNKNQSEDAWNFDIDQEKLSIEDKKQNEPVKEKKIKQKLTLEDQKINAGRTRNEMYEELESKFKDVEDDIVEYAPLSLRGCALFIDLSVYMVTYLVANFTVPMTTWLFSIPMNRYHFSWTMSPVEIYNFMFGINLFIFVNLLLVLPSAFFGSTLGKKIVGLKVRGEKQFSIKYRIVFIREVIIKPLSLLIIIGIFLPFFNKKKKSLHDFACKTLVVID